MYSKKIKFDILTTVGFVTKKCRYKSFLVGLFKGSRYRSYVKAEGSLAKAVCECVKSGEEFHVNCKDFPILVRYYNKKLHIRGFDMLKLRKSFVKIVSLSAKKHCLISFLQGMFISCGYVQNPEKAYHLEFKIKEKWLKSAFVSCVKNLKIKFCKCENSKYTCFYLKSGEKILRFLSLLGLFDRASELSELIEARRVLSGVNRKVNVETSNINKTISASEKSISNIQALFALKDQSFWSENLILTAKTRIKYPHDSIEQLGKRFSPTLSKSAVNHRLRKLNELYKLLVDK